MELYSAEVQVVNPAVTGGAGRGAPVPARMIKSSARGYFRGSRNPSGLSAQPRR
jgi:hypothetical protein